MEELSVNVMCGSVGRFAEALFSKAWEVLSDGLAFLLKLGSDP